jgi:peptidoglycan/xylan/chitin deacetylase (PgdA/CDA1 family)
MKIHKLITLLILLGVTACTSKTQAILTPMPTASATVTVAPTSTFTPAPKPTPTLPAVLITSGDWVSPYVALTFDVCQDPKEPAGFDAALVDVLEQKNIRATFFLGGDWMRTHQEETKRLAANPNFELGDHSWSHADFTKLTDDEIGQELETTEDLLFKLTGRRSRVFRHPYGFYNDATLRAVAKHGLYSVQWDSVSGDPDPNFDAPTILAEVQRTVRDGSIIIMHANGRGWHTAEALPLVIDWLKSKGYTLVTVSQLIGLEHLPPAE